MIRRGTPSDAGAVARLMHALWPDGTAVEHEAEAARTLAGERWTVAPLAIFVAEQDGRVVGFAEASIRSVADGCDPRTPVGYLEGWFVEEPHRRRGVGGALVRAAEDWARAEGCIEMGSDTWIDEEGSIRAHEALGYEIVDRCVSFMKKL